MKAKSALNILLMMFAICGLLMAGADTDNLYRQLLSCTIGVIVFSCSMFTLVFLNGEGE